MKYHLDAEKMHSKRDVEEASHLEAVSIDFDGPIDYEQLKAEIEAKGPIEVVQHQGNVKFRLNITPCLIQDCDCGNDVITLSQISGFTSITTGIQKSELLENESLNAFVHDFHHNPFAYYSSSGERQFIEAEIERHLGFVPLDVYRGKISPENLKATISEAAKDDLWSLHNLQGIFRSLMLQRLEIGHFHRDDFQDEFLQRFNNPEEFTYFLNRIYDLGFLASRMISEHFIRNDIEPLAQRGVAAAKAQHKRASASGKVANRNRHKRISSMLAKMEGLLAANPAFCRLGVDQIADLAIEDAALDDPALWSQGKGQRNEYVDELRSDLRYRESYQSLLSKIA